MERAIAWGSGGAGRDYFPPQGLVCMHSLWARSDTMSSVQMDFPDLSSQYKIATCPGDMDCAFVDIFRSTIPSEHRIHNPLPVGKEYKKYITKGKAQPNTRMCREDGNWQPTISGSILIQLCFGFRTTSEGGTYFSYSNNEGMSAESLKTKSTWPTPDYA